MGEQTERDAEKMTD